MSLYKTGRRIHHILRILPVAILLLATPYSGLYSNTISIEDDLNTPGINLLTPANDTLHKAVILGDIDLVKTLLEQGADPNQKDNIGWTPLDYAKKRNKPAIGKVLTENGAVTFHKVLPDMTEGPHIRIYNADTIEVISLKNEMATNRSTLSSELVAVSDLPDTFDGVVIDPNDIDFNTQIAPVSRTYSGVRKIFVVGDVHGQYDRVYSLLRANEIIDANGNWSWGKGHLVFVGDIFDRGSGVTEALWMIFSLEKQAELAGGKVHMVLGNHELMIFNEDLRYITNDYYALSDNLGLSYSELFNRNTLLGQWLRQKPLMIKINGYLFVHAGISPEMYEKQIGMDQMNSVAWQYLNGMEDTTNTELRKYLFGGSGPQWYRGYVNEGRRGDFIDAVTLGRILDFYGADKFIIGHTEVDNVTSFYSRKVIDVNIPKANDQIIEQGLLIKGRKFLILDNNGTKKRLWD